MKIFDDMELSLLSSMKIGGRAEKVFLPENEEEVMDLMRKYGDNIKIIGGGTNIVFSAGIHKTPYLLATSLNRIADIKDTIVCQCGVPVRTLCDMASEKTLSGFLSLEGIPGTVGGALFGNASVDKGTIFDIVNGMTLISREGKRYIKRDFAPVYRNSGIGDFIFDVTFNKCPGEKEIIEKKRAELRAIRLKQPKGLSCGSVFKNPGTYTAGRLIEEAGMKGRKFGGIMVSSVHSNWFINRGNATYRDLKMAIETVKEAVMQNSGIELQLEIRIYDDSRNK